MSLWSFAFSITAFIFWPLLNGALATQQNAPPEIARASAMLTDAEGNPRGSVALSETANGVLLKATLTNLPPGAHGFHIHENGSCSPDFSAAGEHFAPMEATHGFFDGDRQHAGDMPNIHVGANGKLKIEVLNDRISLTPGDGYLFDENGASIVIHEEADDYQSQPSGVAGDRIACGVIKAQSN